MAEVLKQFNLDLHIHTVLSPCGDLEMGAPDIVAKAMETGIDALAVTDHNIVSNFPAVMGAAKDAGSGILIIPGVEVQTVEDIHIIALFPEYYNALAFQEWLHKGLNDFPNDPDIFGEQLQIDKDNSIIDEFGILLVQGVNYGIDEVIENIRSQEGLTILAHVDRPSFSYISVLGPVPDNLPVDALEISSNVDDSAEEEYCRSYPSRIFTRSSDAHFLSDITIENTTVMLLRELSFREIALAMDPCCRDRRIIRPCNRSDI